jgi:hypothetical protein
MAYYGDNFTFYYVDVSRQLDAPAAVLPQVPVG